MEPCRDPYPDAYGWCRHCGWRITDHHRHRRLTLVLAVGVLLIAVLFLAAALVVAGAAHLLPRQ